MQLVWLTFVFGALNLALGYALAVYLGYGPPTLREAWAAMSVAPRSGRTANDRSSGTDKPIQEPDQHLEPRPALSCPPQPAPAGNLATEPDLNESEALRHCVERAVANLDSLAARLKRIVEGQDGRTAWSFVGELQEVCESYLRHLREITARLCDQSGDSGEATVLSHEAQQIVLEQAAQLETTLSNLQYMDFNTGFSAATARLRTDTGNTLALARRLQEALAAVAETTGQPHAESVGG